MSCWRPLLCCPTRVISDAIDCLRSHPLCAPPKVLSLLSLADFLIHVPVKLIYQCRYLPPLSSMRPMKLSSSAISRQRSPRNTPLIDPKHAVSCCRPLPCCPMKVISNATDCLRSHPLYAPSKILSLLSLADSFIHASHEVNIPMPLLASALIHAPDEATIRCCLPSEATLR